MLRPIAGRQEGKPMDRLPRALGRFSGLGAPLALAALALLAPVGLARTTAGQATPVGGARADDGPHPAHIHSGTCDELGDVVHPLEDVAVPTGEEMGAADAHPVKHSEQTRLDVPLEEILAEDHAINVHLSEDEIDEYIACGDVGGVVHERENGEGPGHPAGTAAPPAPARWTPGGAYSRGASDATTPAAPRWSPVAGRASGEPG